jgi:glutamate-5-semialdehyde dehydrogenase
MLEQIGKNARIAARKLGRALTAEKDKALLAMAESLTANKAEILAANAEDLKHAKADGMAAAMQDRLLLTPERLAEIAEAMRYVASLQDPAGKVIGGGKRPNGLELTQVTVPLGVIGVIFESRPNVTADCAALCLKSGNACILRGGKEAIRSNTAIVKAMRAAIAAQGLETVPEDSVQLVEDTSRETANEMMRLNGVIDLLIPRGGAGLIKAVTQNASVPVIETGAGNCHIFVDESAEAEMAVNIVDNAKTQRPSVCNAAETLLIHENCAERLLPVIAKRLEHANVELRACEKARAFLPGAKPATEEDYATEFDDYILAVKVVADIDEAMEHIEKYSTRHSEAIITQSYENGRRFLNEVDSAAVYVNASTRFTDGGVFGLGAEIGISTQKLHARGPMGLNHLTSTKYMIAGNGQIRP